MGLVFAAVLLTLLFGTEKLRSDLSVSQWHDPVWLAWLAAPVYMLHNFEEYGVDALGRLHYFPDSLCSTLGLPFYPACPVPPVFFLAVNISLIWVAAPIAALLSRRHSLVGFSFYGLLVANGLTHVVPMILGNGYNPGALSGLLLFLPLFFWVARTCFGKRGIGYRGLIVIVAAGVGLHLSLMGSLWAFIHGAIGSTALISLQIANAGLFLVIPQIGERLLRPTAKSVLQDSLD